MSLAPDSPSQDVASAAKRQKTASSDSPDTTGNAASAGTATGLTDSNANAKPKAPQFSSAIRKKVYLVVAHRFSDNRYGPKGRRWAKIAMKKDTDYVEACAAAVDNAVAVLKYYAPKEVRLG
eukprot:g2313.t1